MEPCCNSMLGTSAIGMGVELVELSAEFCEHLGIDVPEACAMVPRTATVHHGGKRQAVAVCSLVAAAQRATRSALLLLTSSSGQRGQRCAKSC